MSTGFSSVVIDLLLFRGYIDTPLLFPLLFLLLLSVLSLFCLVTLSSALAALFFISSLVRLHLSINYFTTTRALRRLSGSSPTRDHLEPGELNKGRVFIALYTSDIPRITGRSSFPIRDGNTHITDGNCGSLWRFREKRVDPDAPYLLVGTKARIGQPALRVPNKQLRENCAIWIKEAITKLQEGDLADEFDIPRFMDDALAFAGYHTKHGLGMKCHFSTADHYFLHTKMKCTMLNYTQRRMS
ncbi:hypothetical protein N7476_009848 [Penicillium atrosanguineum]|uniref:Uncharacterized protein n=1 Tax=Penicillium atrosanguineum TaxID=1132637 RepID=A0A9W9PR11_9EURO|nr:hypothetical protein N7476_009848 [Penicillium atrosanguineum]